MGKRLYVLRHGKSPQLGEAGVSRDEERPLAQEGRDAVRKMAAYLAQEGGKPSRVLTSPLVRARETAKEAAAVLKLSAPEEFRYLSGEASVERLWEALESRLDEETIIVGHQPQLGELVMHLTGTLIDIKPGGLVALELTQERVRILWSKNPKDLK